MQEIIHTDSHTLGVDTTKNRIYCTISKQDDLPEILTFMHEWVEARGLVFEGFTVLTDVSEMQTPTLDWLIKSTWIHKMLSAAPLAGIAEVFSEPLAGNMRNSEMKKIFTNKNEAET